MPTRTFKMAGSVTSDSDANITVTFNGTQVFDGAVSSSASELCTFTADTTVTGNVATTVVVNSGSVLVGPLSANYVVYEGECSHVEGVGTDSETHTYYSADDVTSIYAPMNEGLGDSMSSVQVDSEDTDLTFSSATGWIPVPVQSGSTLSCDMVVDAIASA